MADDVQAYLPPALSAFPGPAVRSPRAISPCTLHRMNDRTITLNIIRAGQPRAYADSVYEGVFTFSWQPNETDVKAIAKVMLHPFVDEPTHALESRLQKFEKRTPNQWHIEILSPFTD
jgi:hypothetical protein